MNHAGHNGNEVKEALKVIAPDPVDQVEGAIHPQEEEVMSCDGLRFARLADHEELRQDCNRLQVDRERPQNLHWREVMIDEERQSTNGDNQEFHPERVVVSIIRSLKLEVDQVHCGKGTYNVDDLHATVVEGDENREQIQVSSGKHKSEEHLTLPRDTGTRPGLPHLQQQDYDGHQVREVAGQPKDVHGGRA